MRQTPLAKVSQKKLAEHGGRIFSTFTSPRARLANRSAKRVVQDREERTLKQQLWTEQEHRCADCHWKAESIGELHKHEDQPRGRGGDATEHSNCVLLCAGCHRHRHDTNQLKSGHQPVTPSPLGRPWSEH